MALSKHMRIGIIGEEVNDVDVIRILAAKIAAGRSLTINHFVGHGCGKLRKKCAAWAENLLKRGCTHLIVVHDCDRHVESTLREELNQKIRNVPFQAKLVLIPVEELEAWLLTDRNALRTIFNMRRLPKVPQNTESIESPKEFLSDIVSRNSKSRYLNTVHNVKIASEICLDELARCRTFVDLPKFLNSDAK